MTQIHINIQIDLDGNDLAAAIDKLAAIGRGLALLQAPPKKASPRKKVSPRAQRAPDEEHEEKRSSLRDFVVESGAKRTETPTAHESTAASTNTVAPTIAPQIAAIPPASVNGSKGVSRGKELGARGKKEPDALNWESSQIGVTGVPCPLPLAPLPLVSPLPPQPAPTPRERRAHNRRPNGPSLPFEEFDELCRSEMKRLAMDRRLPGRVLWDSERDKRLPTLDAVRMRYKCATLVELAEQLGYEPPLHGGKKEVRA